MIIQYSAMRSILKISPVFVRRLSASGTLGVHCVHSVTFRYTLVNFDSFMCSTSGYISVYTWTYFNLLKLQVVSIVNILNRCFLAGYHGDVYIVLTRSYRHTNHEQCFKNKRNIKVVTTSHLMLLWNDFYKLKIYVFAPGSQSHYRSHAPHRKDDRKGS
jgi:hypothetical protein